MTRKGGSGGRDGQRQGPSDELSVAFDLLRAPRRRYTLQYLCSVDADVVELDELATHVLEREASVRDVEQSAERRQEVYRALYHTHVPRLATADVTTYEASDDAVRLERIPEPLARGLELAREFEGIEPEE